MKKQMLTVEVGIVKSAIDMVQKWEEAITRFEAVRWELTSVENGSRRIDCGNMREMLFDRLLDSYRTLFMWAIVSKNEALIDAAKERARTYFLGKDSCVIQYLFGGVTPGGWSGETENKLREFIQEKLSDVKVKKS